MASLTNTKIKNTYVSLLKVADNGQLDAALQDITDGAGNVTGVQLNTGGDLAASGTVSFGSLKDTGENITISKFVDAADGIGSNNNDTTIPTSAAVATYVAAQITAEDLDFAGDTGTGAVDLDSQTLTIAGTANEIETVASGQTLTIGLPSTINVNVSGNLTGTVTSASVLQDGVTATTQLTSDSSTKVATTAFVKSVLTLENLDIAGSSGTGSVDLDSQVLTIAGTTNEIETVASGQTITVGLPSDVTIGNNLTVTTNATVGGTFGVTGATGVDGDFDVNTNKFNVQAATGNTSVAGTLGVTGNTTLSTVDVTGLASLDGGIDVDGAFTVADTSGNISTSGTLGVTGTSTLGVINASGLASLDGGIDVDGAFTVADTSGNVSTTGSITAATGTINGLLDVVGEVQATFLDINGNGELSGNFAVDTDTLFVDATNDRVGVNKTNPAVALDVTGDIASSGTITGTTLAGTLSTAAQPNITSVGTLSSLAVSGNLTVDTNTLYVDSANNRVGIGTSSPETSLSVIGSSGLSLRNNTGVDADEPKITFLNSTFAGSTPAIVRSGNGGLLLNLESASTSTFLNRSKLVLNGGTTSDIIFSRSANNGSTFSESMRIDSSGNVGIGTSSPAGKLDISASQADTSGITGAVNITNSVSGTVVNAIQTAATTNACFYRAQQVSAGADDEYFFLGQTGNGAAITTNKVLITTNGAATFSGNITLPNGNGIDFSASAGGGATSSLLDDYEEGTWTMGISFGDANVGATYSENTGSYTKIGRQVTVNGWLIITSKGSSTGNAKITGLPFTIDNDVSYYSGLSIGYYSNITYTGTLLGYGAINTTTIGLNEISEAGVVSDITNADFADNSNIMISLTYFV